MATTHQTRERSRQRSLDPYSASTPQSQRNMASSGPAGTKRLFSNRQSRQSFNGEDQDENEYNDEVGDTPASTHTEKRQRSGDWPLVAPSPAPSSSSRPQHRRYRDGTNSPPSSTSRRHASSLQRPSRFVEGSMNDRVSQKPPVPYLGTDEELQERYEREQLEYNRGRRGRSHINSTISVSGETDTSRHSSIFRFGKSIAASFNPSNWKIFSKQAAHEQEDEEAKQMRVLRERQEKAQRIYKELKESGHFRDSTIPGHETFLDTRPLGKHDSGVSFVENGGHSRASMDSRTSREEKRMGRVFLEPPQFDRGGESLASNTGSHKRATSATPNRPMFALKNASLSNLRKSFLKDTASPVEGNGHQARRIPSRKDLQKQQKLVKRVSDLEGKLEAARRQLNQSLSEPLPPRAQLKIGRSKFVPGAMPTLPSERLLAGYVPSDDESVERDEEIGKAVTVDDGLVKPSPAHSYDRVVQSVEHDEVSLKDSVMSEAATTVSSNFTRKSDGNYINKEEDENSEELEEEEVESDKEPTPKPEPKRTTISKKRKGPFQGVADDGGIYQPADTESEPDSPIKKPTPRKSSIPAPRKLQKVSASNPPKHAPPPPPTKSSTAHLPTVLTPYQAPPSKSIKTSSTSSPSAQPKPRQKIIKKAGSTRNTTSNGRPPSRGKQDSPSHQIKTQKPTQKQQSISPPPSSTFTGLQYTKPTPSLTTTKRPTTNHKTDDMMPPSSVRTHTIKREEENNSEEENERENEDKVPPMPKLPRQVRLPSGEVVDVHPRAGSRGRGLRAREGVAKVKKEGGEDGDGGDGDGGVGESIIVEEKGTENDESKNTIGVSKSSTQASFEWPEDVF